ncbi:tyrosine-type recombinase/integrase [Paramagnetospirillum magneticum]|uniref:Tyr recombinase domain-containing protein n=1 Tax=Paramagnetospirillum magneticum (strain ATCC 700264 / AMB-1) TaxID=342108 RepID=Q2W580_PARM1|nr:tyrosine-type recombinase/integrase [Paramagnetospirillum magneticum]BAE50995.1 hypothetical protein amb2191 [Paramagnetospirillum magneticum AMB-1]
MAGKQAKVLTATQISTVLLHLGSTRHGFRDRVMFLLSAKAGMRAKEIAMITWSMLLTATGEVGDMIHLEDKATKRSSGRSIPINRELRSALVELHGQGNSQSRPSRNFFGTRYRDDGEHRRRVVLPPL